MMDIRQSHIEEFNMFLILLIVSLPSFSSRIEDVRLLQTDLLFGIPPDLLANILDVTHLNSIE